MSLPDIHLCVIQPPGHAPALGLLDPARYFRYHFRRLGARVSLSKNRLRHDAINFVFGAHLGFDTSLCQRHTCVFVNLEQLGPKSAHVTTQYVELLRRSAVIDYDPLNLTHYTRFPDDVPLVPFVHGAYLSTQPLSGLSLAAQGLALEDRPIDLLFLGTMNERQRHIIEQIESCGVNVSVFDRPLYGNERDAYIRQAKAVLDCPASSERRFEPMVAAHCLSLGTPVLAIRTVHTLAAPFYDEALTWLNEETVLPFFAQDYASPAWFALAREQLAYFEQLDPVEAFADVLAFASGYGQTHVRQRDSQPWTPTRLHLGAGNQYRNGWLNLDTQPQSEPDLVLDLSVPQVLPMQRNGTLCGPVRLGSEQFEDIHASDALTRCGDLPTLMTQVLALLAEGGRFTVEVPCEHAATAWQDPRSRRAFSENAWHSYTDAFWLMGWFEHRFQIEQSGYQDLQHKPCAREAAAYMRVVLQKVPTTPAERTQARLLRSDCLVPEDAVAPEEQLLPPASSRPLQALLQAEESAPSKELLLAVLHQH